MEKKSGPCPCDRAKSGVKRVPLTDAAGIVVGLCIDSANRPDMKLTHTTLDSLPPIIAAKRDAFLFGAVDEEGMKLEAEWKRILEGDWEPDPEAPQNASGLCLDAGFDYEEVRAAVWEWGYTAHIRSRGEEKQVKIAGYKARRWVVERTHSWLNRYRRLLIRWEKKPTIISHYSISLALT